MLDNIDTILLRANAILLDAWKNPQTKPRTKAALVLAYSKMNAGQHPSMAGVIKDLPIDPDGSQTLTAARFVAEAMGLQVVGRSELNEGCKVGRQHLVVFRTGPDESSFECHAAKIASAGLSVEIRCEPHALAKTLDRRRKTGQKEPRQPSLF